jgi:hypothetical protein
MGHIRTAKKKLKEVEFDAFAVSGNSGTLMGGAMSAAMKKKMILVRKPSDNSHSSYTVEGDESILRFVFLDDQIATGATRTRVVTTVKAWLPKVEFVGTYLYNKSGCFGYDPDYVKPKKKRPAVKKLVKSRAKIKA